MGMYTEFHFNVELKEETPEEIITILNYMLSTDSSKNIDRLPENDLFKTDRWRFMLLMDSYCFKSDTVSTLRYDDIAKRYFLCIRCNLKNYFNEIEKFIIWIKPYIDAIDGDFLGFSRYEEHNEPNLIYY